MNAVRPHRRRAVALLLVLAVLVTLVPLLAWRARVVLASRLLLQATYDQANASALLDAADPIVERWLQRDADSLVLPPDRAAPLHRLLGITVELPGGSAQSLTIVAVDQHALPRHDMLASPLFAERVALDERLVAALERLEAGDSLAPGWDTVAAVLDARHPPHRASAPRTGDPTISPYGLPQLAALAADSSSERDAPPPIAAVALHPDPPNRPSSSTPEQRINVSTAPPEILAALDDAFGFSIAKPVLDARRRDQRPDLAALRIEPTDSDSPILITNSSDAWLFLLHARAPTASVSRVLVYHRLDSGWARTHAHIVRNP